MPLLLRQVCVQPSPSAVNTTLPAFAAERHAAAELAAATIDQYLLPAGPTAANQPHAAAAGKWDRQMDRHMITQTLPHTMRAVLLTECLFLVPLSSRQSRS